MVRAGENAFLYEDFKNFNIVAVGWEVQDLSGKNPDEIKQIMENTYSDVTKTSLAIQSAQVIKFVCEFEIGDYVLSYDHFTRKYLVGQITSDYYYSDILSKKYNMNSNFYCHLHNVKWIGETIRDDLSDNTAKSLNAILTIFSIQDASKNDILYRMNENKIEWTDFYMELADKLIEYKDDRLSLINKIQNIFNELNMNLPSLERNDDGNIIIPYDIDPFTVFALFNKQISAENRINIIKQFKKEFLISAEAPNTFHGIAVVNNMAATFYYFNKNRGVNDIDNLWNVFEAALNYSDENKLDFIEIYDKIIMQKGIRWNITMALNWIRPFNFINLDANNRTLLSQEEIFSNEFRDEIKSFKSPPSGEEYLKICQYCNDMINETGKYGSLPALSHSAYLNNLKNNEESSDDGIGDGDVKNIQYWLISPGNGAKFWDEFYENGEMGIGFDGTGDLNQYNSKEELKIKFQEMYDDNSSHRNNVHACWQFVHDIQIGDVVFAKNGMTEIIGKGIVEGDYEYDTNKPYHKIRKVKWTNNGNWESKDILPMKTLTDITNYTEFVKSIKELFIDEEDDEDEISEIEYPEYSLDKFLEEVYISEDDYNTLFNLLINKKNIIIEGAPGVGKTYMAKRLAYSIMGEKNSERVMMVQFHQSYSYEDFVMGFRPVKDGFELKHGSFYQFCKKAEVDDENDYFFIIDEINRGNLSKIFGELFMLIENDKRGEKNKIQLLYSDESFFIPKNVYIIGLMNTADRSLAMLDYALRRRFAFFDLKPAFSSEGFINYQMELNDSRFNNLVLAIKELNEEIKNDESLGEGFRIGHSYLCNLKSADNLDFIVEYELIPLLKEYWFDEQDKVRYWSDKLRSVIEFD